MKEAVHRSAKCRVLGYSLMEVMISTFVATLVTGAVIRSTMVASSLSFACTQELTAFSLAKAKYEEMRSMEYDELSAAAGWETNLEFVHRSGVGQEQQGCYRYTSVDHISSPESKRIRVILWWYDRHRWRNEQVWGMVYPG